MDLDAEVETILAAVPADLRLLVTTHEALGYFADRYGFDILGTALPGLSSLAAANPADLEDLSTMIISSGVPAVFAEAEVSDTELAAVADRLDGVRVVPLLTESLGPDGTDGDTYVGVMVLTATTIADGLGN